MASPVCSGREVFVCSWREVFVCSWREVCVCSWRVVCVCSGREVFIEKSLTRFLRLPPRANRTNFNFFQNADLFLIIFSKLRIRFNNQSFSKNQINLKNNRNRNERFKIRIKASLFS
ncbi:hypothetical protein [Methanimicrococcus hongohii]|uniref:hypothetical protein n=1 Tax=Methanimicrococcus hongohii TaxID=3028295 RepID=UPI00292F690F|nr:hypothetical protein [Methanimicrococcus sp. Hf6]